MKKIGYFVVIIWFTITTTLLRSPAQSHSNALLSDPEPVRRALLIAISNYAPGTGWSPLNADKDAELLAEVLHRQHFMPENIVLLIDSQATYSGILNAINELTRVAKPGDMVFVHFSGHGQQILDDNGDEIDGYDEALIPYDAGMYYIPGIYEGENHLRDDLLGQLLDTLRNTLGPRGSLLVSLDACHSGTATRGMGTIRGTAEKFQPPGTAPRTAPSTMRSGQKEPFGLASNITGTAPMMVISASAPHENNYEMVLKDGSSIGSLTWILARSLERTPPKSSNLALFHQVRLTFARIHPFQQPQCEGDTDHLLFSGESINRPPYFLVTDQPNDTTLLLNGGALSGLMPGTTVGFFPPDIRNPFQIKPLAIGVVGTDHPMAATVVTREPLNRQLARGAWVYCLQPAYSTLNLSIDVQIPEQHPMYDTLLATLGKLPFLKITQQNAKATLTIDTPGNTLQIYSHTGSPLLAQNMSAIHVTDQHLTTLTDRLWMMAQAEYLRHLEAEAPEIAASVRIVPVPDIAGAVTGADELPPQSDTPFPTETIPVFNPGDLFALEITNQGSRPVWFNLIDIQPDHLVHVIMPTATPPRITIHDLRLEPGAKYRTNPFQVNPPHGLETIKCITTPIPVDLSLAFIPPGQRPVRRGTPAHPLDAVLNGHTNYQLPVHRGGQVNPSAAAHVETLHFYIQPKIRE